ncbi:MAG: trigger factor [Proteobacteria bacterium]|nr:trigger factor [Pseudomonadota bacterium]
MTDARILEESVDGLSHTFVIGIDAHPVNAAVNERLRDLGRTARVPGFRPGRAPLAMLRNLHAERIRATIVDHLAIDVARRLIAERALEPSRRPTIRIDEDGSVESDSVTFTLLLEVMPRVELGELRNFSLRRFRVPEDNPELAGLAREHLRRQLFDALIDTHDFPIPRDMAEGEYGRISRGFEANVGEKVDAELEAELRRIAERRIRLAILLTEIGRAHRISVPRSEVEALVEAQTERDPEHQSEIIDYYLDNPTALAELQSPLFEERVVEFLLAQSEVTVVELSAEELRREMGAM